MAKHYAKYNSLGGYVTYDSTIAVFDAFTFYGTNNYKYKLKDIEHCQKFIDNDYRFNIYSNQEDSILTLFNVFIYV